MNPLRESWLPLLLLLCCASPLSLFAQQGLSPRYRPIVLFDGRNTDNFYSWLVDSKYNDPRHVFTLTNNMIRISGDGLGYLASRADYQDYRLVAEWKWGNRNSSWGDRIGHARDSGIFLHSLGPDGSSHDGKGAFRMGIECNLFDGATGDLLLIRGTNADGSLLAPKISATVAAERDSDGWPFWAGQGIETNIVTWGRLNWSGKDHSWKDVTGFRGRADVEKPAGEWNRLECVCEGDRISVILNGQMVNQASKVYPTYGKILIQCEGSEIFFRRLELLPLKQ
jgi:hypothetical protein